MTLVKYRRPFGTIDGPFESWNRGLFPALYRSCGVEASDEAALRLPRTNVEEREGSYVFTMEMPGLAKKDIEVSLENDTLTVKGNKVEESEEKEGKGFLRREIRSSKFERNFSLGNEVDQENIKAKMDDGILSITVPKRDEKVGRKVDVL
jgi:HSP20 family protein